MKLVGIELYKLRRKHLFSMVMIFLLVEISWAFVVTARSVSGNSVYAGWEALIAMLSSMNGLFFPVLTAVCVSRICDMEHKGNTRKLLLTMSVKQNRLYAAKYASAAIVMFTAAVLQALAAAAFGITSAFERSVPLFLLFRFLTATIITNMIVAALQQWISMAVKNQAFALTFGMIGGFIGVVADLLPHNVRKVFIWSYYTGLSPVTQFYTGNHVIFSIRDTGSMVPVMTVLIIAGIVIYFAGSFHVSRQEL